MNHYLPSSLPPPIDACAVRQPQINPGVDTPPGIGQPLPASNRNSGEVNESASSRRHVQGGGIGGRDNHWMRKHRDLVAVRSRLRVVELARLVALEGLSFQQAAQRMGLHPKYVRTVLWPRVKEMSIADFSSPEERERVCYFVISVLTDVAVEARRKMSEHAAYGAIAIQAVSKLAELYGIDLSERSEAQSVATLAEVGAEVKRVAPLLGSKLEAAARIRALRGRAE